MVSSMSWFGKRVILVREVILLAVQSPGRCKRIHSILIGAVRTAQPLQINNVRLADCSYRLPIACHSPAGLRSTVALKKSMSEKHTPRHWQYELD
jgi:hypothetical protein